MDGKLTWQRVIAAVVVTVVALSALNVWGRLAVGLAAFALVGAPSTGNRANRATA